MAARRGGMGVPRRDLLMLGACFGVFIGLGGLGRTSENTLKPALAPIAYPDHASRRIPAR
ncbi:MAG: hypothetical protein E8D45_03950 [Nitrospira sp.]|nr:MAG: hypothetical protein E8D45_03950 [Nitrospira sp.]